jgi:hypothetical protein
MHHMMIGYAFKTSIPCDLRVWFTNSFGPLTNSIKGGSFHIVDKISVVSKMSNLESTHYIVREVGELITFVHFEFNNLIYQIIYRMVFIKDDD